LVLHKTAASKDVQQQLMANLNALKQAASRLERPAIIAIVAS